MNSVNNIELTTAQDVFFDFCLWEYQPIPPFIDKYRSINLLYNSFDIAGVDQSIYDVCQAIRKGIGTDKTVWGVKLVDGKLCWELYFYDYKRLQRELSINRLNEILRPFMACDLEYSEDRPYFMFSIDLAEKLAPLEKIEIYVGNIGCTVSSGVSYALTKDDLVFDNLYYFFDAKKEMEQIKGKIASSAYLDLCGLDMASILWSELSDCKCIVVANKRYSDGIYYSGITIEQLTLFLRRLEYPQQIIDYVESNKSKLDHMFYDVGVDYRMEAGQVKILKSSYYGIF
ncbi:MAG: hypothetical protein KAT04_03980 [Methylococcales bacterium]|nr:hypothetical protein [Methylococcales bacterium]